MGLLGGIRVVDAATGIAGSYATKLFADAGADVVVLEPPGGSPLRSWATQGPAAGDGALFEYLHHGKRSVVASPSDATATRLVAGADVVVEDFEDAAIGRGWHAGVAGLVVTSITPFGRTGPYAQRPATHLTIEAESGSLAMRQRPGIPPFQAGGRIAHWVAGAYAAVAALACARRARRSGHGEYIDCSLHETMTISGSLFLDMMSSLVGRPSWPAAAEMLETPSIEPTADGWIGFNTNTRTQFEAFCILIGRPELAADEQLATAAGRSARWDEWNEIVHRATTARTTADLLDEAARLRIPAAPVGTGRTVAGFEHFAQRGTFVAAPSGRFHQPRPPYLVDGSSRPIPGPAPELDEHRGARFDDGPARPAPDGPVPLPLAGLRVVDLTNWWAGPAGTHMLATLGADVVKIESIQRPDGMRFAGVAGPGRDSWWDYGFMFCCANTNKRELTLDLTRPAGVELAKGLVTNADVVVENYSPRVVEGFGLDWPVVHELNPRAVMVRMPAFGLDGPWRDNVGFAQTMEQVTGMAWCTGHRFDQPRIPRGPCDPNAGMHGMFALLAALAQRDRTGEGVLVEAPMVESALNVAAEQVVEWTAYGVELGRDGNRSPECAPQGLYPTADGEDAPVAISVEFDEQWRALCAVVGREDWACDEALATREGRRRAHDELDAGLSEWSRTLGADAAVARLLAVGVPAATLTDPRSTSAHPHLEARGFYEWVEHPVVGRHLHPTVPFRFDSVTRWLDRPAPTLGEHNVEVLTELGCDEGEIAALRADEIIGTTPLGL